MRVENVQQIVELPWIFSLGFIDDLAVKIFLFDLQIVFLTFLTCGDSVFLSGFRLDWGLKIVSGCGNSCLCVRHIIN